MTSAPASAPATLDRIEIRSPCTVPWDSMRGDARTRFCTQCRQSVHDISRRGRSPPTEGGGGSLVRRAWT